MTRFTKEQLSGLARENVRVLTLAAKQHPGQPVIAMDLRLAEIALDALTAPEDNRIEYTRRVEAELITARARIALLEGLK
ncbi:hypothetical protein [Citrobacter braakii]|uniref:hypothetical protein n=1 Tax=Citrobacter braakii TaxID=57706 RepID=UPI001C7D1FF9|nr:hypothetical protein [Citrobacter braakii]